MGSAYRINAVSDIPVYRQLVDEIRSNIKKGILASGEQLPTVMALADELGLARGTIKRAYDELEQMGLIEKIQGRGSFVCYQAPSPAGRKDQAMAAIDAMLDCMGELGFSQAEVQIFLDLKLREREARQSKVKVAVVECNQENLSRLSDQLRTVAGVELHAHLLDHVRTYPYNLGEEMDLIVTTVEHGEYIQSILAQREKVARVALRLSPQSMARIVKLQAGDCVGILSRSLRFARLLRAACETYTEQTELCEPQEFSDAATTKAYLHGKTAVLVPEEFEKYASAEAAAQLREFAKEKALIPCAYEMDEGSFLFLQEKIARLHEKKLK